MRIANNKLSYKIIDKLMQPAIQVITERGDLVEIQNVTSTEIDFLLYLSSIQNEFGKVIGVHYKTAMLELSLKCKQTYYNSIRGLEEKGYILSSQGKGGYWDFLIVDNMFLNDDDDKNGYFNTNRQFLFEPEFKALKANEKKLCIKLAISYQEDNFNKFGLHVYPKTIAKWLGIKSVGLVFNYMESIEMFFPSTRKDGVEGELFVIEKGNAVPFNTTGQSERENHLTHKFKYFCSTFKIPYTTQDLKDLIILVGQYAKKGLSKVYRVIFDVLLSKRSVEPKLINSILSGRGSLDPAPAK